MAMKRMVIYTQGKMIRMFKAWIGWNEEQVNWRQSLSLDPI